MQLKAIAGLKAAKLDNNQKALLERQACVRGARSAIYLA
jgi:hypothetical protein